MHRYVEPLKRASTLCVPLLPLLAALLAIAILAWFLVWTMDVDEQQPTDSFHFLTNATPVASRMATDE